MKLYALSDLHLGYDANRDSFAALAPHPDDWLILAGDMGETDAQLESALQGATARFARVIWVPGNHELWTLEPNQPRGAALYDHRVAQCRRHGVLTPEDDYPAWLGEGGPCTLVPMFLLYDYSFRPAHVTRAAALAWAEESGVRCTDEELLHADPFPSREAWCHARLQATEARLLQAAALGRPLVLINHFPLRQDLVRIPRVPRFSLWCGTTRTEDWHLRFNAKVVVSGHLHVRATDWRDGVRFEEVSLGYPRQWQAGRDTNAYLREILPGPTQLAHGHAGPVFHR